MTTEPNKRLVPLKKPPKEPKPPRTLKQRVLGILVPPADTPFWIRIGRLLVLIPLVITASIVLAASCSD